MNFEAAIFDMDGTLLDTERLFRTAWREAAEACGQKISDELYAELIGLDENVAVDRLESYWLTTIDRKEFLANAERAYLEIINSRGIEIRPGILELIDLLEKRSLRLAVATSTPKKIAVKKLSLAGILDRFETVVGGDEITCGKPAPDIFLEASVRIGIKPEKCLVFEDSKAGLESSNAANMKCVWVPDLYIPNETEKKFSWKAFDSHVEVVNFFEKNNIPNKSGIFRGPDFQGA